MRRKLLHHVSHVTKIVMGMVSVSSGGIGR